MKGISTHVLDVSVGKPAAGIAVHLDHQEETGWKLSGHAITDADGRCRELNNSPLVAGQYRLVFNTGAYFDSLGILALYPEVTITFSVRDPGQHHHIPLLLAPNGYTTYRGS